MINKEQWRPVKGYEGYEISSFGRVASYRRKTAIIMKPQLNNAGYLVVWFSYKKRNKIRLVHRLVAAAFCTARQGRNVVNHKDGNRLNNKASNLEWVTTKENVQDALQRGSFTPAGSGSATAKLTDEQVIKIREEFAAGVSQKELTARHGTTFQNIHCIVRRKSWSHLP